MAYMRGDHYLWRDDRSMHFWAVDGYDSWDESGWAEGRAPAVDGTGPGPTPGGVSLPQEVADEYVVMRVAELVGEGLLPAAVARALARHAGNFGCAALRKLATPIVAALQPMTQGRGEEICP